MERIEPFGGHIEDLRAAFGPAAIINNMRALLNGKDATMVDMRHLIPWGERPEAPQLLHDPASPNYDAEAHAAALRALFDARSRQ